MKPLVSALHGRRQNSLGHDEKVSPACNRRIARARLGERSPSRSPEAGFKPMEMAMMEKMENERRSVL